MFQEFWIGAPSCVSRRTAPGLEMWTTLNGPSHMGESLCNPSLERTRLRTRSPVSSVLERMLRSGNAAAIAGTLPLLMQLRDDVPPPARDPSPAWRPAAFHRTPGPVRSDA